MSRAAVVGGSEVAREVNRTIRETCTRFHFDAATTGEFVCECGCYTRLSLTLADYDAHVGPLYAEGHPPRMRRGGRVRELIVEFGDAITRRTTKA